MAQATPYQRGFDFTDFATDFPASPPPGVRIDAEFDAVGLTLGETLTNLALIQRDDGQLRNGAVRLATLHSEVLAAIALAGIDVAAWATATVYTAGRVLTDGDRVYLVATAHTSGVLATDLAADRLIRVFDSGILSDLVSAIGATMVGTADGALQDVLEGIRLVTVPYASKTAIVHSLTNGVSEESARVEAAKALLADGWNLELRGRWLWGSAVEIDGLEDLDIYGGGTIVRLEAKAWTDRAALILRDCKNSKVGRGITWECAGAAFVAGAWAAVPAIAVISTGDNNSPTKIAENIEVDGTFRDCATHAVAARLVNGIKVKGTYRVKQPGCAFVELARCDNINLFEGDWDEGWAPGGIEVYGSCVAIGPGDWAVDEADWEFETRPALNWCGIPSYDDKIDVTAPSGVSTWTFSFEGFGTPAAPTGYDYADSDWFFVCYDTAGAEDLQNEQIHVASVNTATGEITVNCTKLDGVTALNFTAQKFYVYAINTSRFCKGVTVQGCKFSNASGAGIFLLGCDGVVLSGNRGSNNLDFALDCEWCINVAISGNTITNTRADVNEAIGLLYFIRSATVTGNTIVNAPGTSAAGIFHIGAGEVSADISICGNTIVNGAITAATPNAAHHVIVDGLTIAENTIRGPTVGIDVLGNAKHAIKGLSIKGNRLYSIMENPIRLGGVFLAEIEENKVFGSRYRGLAIIEGAGADSSKIHIGRNRLRQGGQEGISLPVVYFGGTGTAPLVTFDDHWLQDEGEAIGVARELYADSGGTIATLRRNEAKITLGTSVLAAGAEVTADATVYGARSNMGVQCWSYTAPGDRLIRARISADNIVTLHVRNIGAGNIDPAGDYGVLVAHR